MSPLSKFHDINVDHVRKLARFGHGDNFMADFFDTSVLIWKQWKKEHPEFFAEVTQWKKARVPDVEAALLKRSLGYEYTEVTFEATGQYEDIVDMTTEEITSVATYRKKVVIKSIAPDVAACKFYLTNIVPEEWRSRIEVLNTNAEELSTRVRAARKRQLEDKKQNRMGQILQLPEALS